MKIKTKQIDVGGALNGQDLKWDDSETRWNPKGWYQYSENFSNLSTTSTSWQTALTLTLSAGAPAGNYFVFWNFIFGSNATSGDVLYRVRLNNATNIMFYDIELMEPIDWHTPEKMGNVIYNLPSGAGDFITVQYRTPNSNRTCHIRDIALSVRLV